MIGIKDEWISRSLIWEIRKRAGWNKRYYKISNAFCMRKIILYFNMKYIQNMPSVICDLIVSYDKMEVENNYCMFCDKTLASDKNFQKHISSKGHNKMLNKKFPTYFPK